MRRSRYVSALIVAASVVAMAASPSHAGFVTSFEFGVEDAFDDLIPLSQEMFPPLPPELDLGGVNLLPIPDAGLAVPFPDGSNTMTIAGGGAVVATVGLQDFYYGPDGGLYELAFPGAISFESPVEDLSFTFWSIIEGQNPGMASVQAFDADMNPLGGPVLPNAVVLDGLGITDLVTFEGPVSSLVWTVDGIPGVGEGWGIDFLSATTLSDPSGAIPEPGTAILLGLGLAALVTRSRSVE